jgi:predicted nuclease with TOPRIM domain
MKNKNNWINPKSIENEESFINLKDFEKKNEELMKMNQKNVESIDHLNENLDNLEIEKNELEEKLNECKNEHIKKDGKIKELTDAISNLGYIINFFQKITNIFYYYKIDLTNYYGNLFFK